MGNRSSRGSVIQIITNNYCNLHCEWCSFLCHIPMRKDSEWVGRREKWDMPASEAELFCERFKGYYEESTHKIMGGETTAMPPEKLYAIIDVFHNNNRRLKLLTNGFNIFGLDKNYLKKFYFIEMNDHGINHKHIMDCHKYLKTFYSGETKIRTVYNHYDLGATRLTCFEGSPCDESIMRPPMLCRGVIYPCCIHPGTELWNNNWKMSEALKAAGWSLENPDVCKVTENWRETIPAYVMDQCMHNCWIPRRCRQMGRSVRISLKPNDVIKKLIR